MLFGIPTQTIVVGVVCAAAGAIGGAMYAKSAAAADIKALTDLNAKHKVEIESLTKLLDQATSTKRAA